MLDETEHEISLHAKTVKPPVFLKVTKLSWTSFLTFLANIGIRNSFLLSYLRFMIRCKEQEIGFKKRMPSCYNIIGLDIMLFMGVRTIFVKVLASWKICCASRLFNHLTERGLASSGQVMAAKWFWYSQDLYARQCN